jgi:nucleotide-binding universal stress UspA family protein
MIERVLVAVDDSPESLEAARTAARLAVGWGAWVRVLTVVEDDVVGEELEAVGGPGTAERRMQGARRLLDHVVADVHGEGVPTASIDMVVQTGAPFRRILEQARTWPADIVVMAVSDRRGVRSSYVGSETEQVLEFSECPVLVVPARSGHRSEEGIKNPGLEPSAPRPSSSTGPER